MTKLTEKELDDMANIFKFKALRERYRVLESIFDIQEGDVVIDGGAFTGDMATYFSKKVGPTGKVYSLEPYPMNMRLLRNHLSHYKLNNVVPINVALWNIKDVIPFYLSDYTNAGSPLKEFRKVNQHSKVIVRSNTLDNIVKEYNIPKIDYIWLNIEGSEVNALEGMKQVLTSDNVKLCISTHKVTESYINTQDVIDLLKSYGYQCNTVENHNQWVYGYKP
jgi:FkbM family methyltransferase